MFPNRDYETVHSEIVSILETSRQQAARAVNATMTTAYWRIGRSIVECEQRGKQRAEYGDALISRLATDLGVRFGRGFSQRNLRLMRKFYLQWSAKAIRQTVSANSDLGGMPSFPLPWSAYVQLMSVSNDHARLFYEAEALRCGWSVRQLDRQINSQYYERSALSRDIQGMLSTGTVTSQNEVMKDHSFKEPFILEFLGLRDQYSESDLEEALISNLSSFLLELGDDFAFVGRQRRLRIDDTWFRVDLLLYHRRLRCLLVVDLKLGQFTHADAGQMHVYLNYAAEHWQFEGENRPIGLILCTSKGENLARYALEGLPNKVIAAEYRTALPDEATLEKHLDEALEEISRRPTIETFKNDL